MSIRTCTFIIYGICYILKFNGIVIQVGDDEWIKVKYCCHKQQRSAVAENQEPRDAVGVITIV